MRTRLTLLAMPLLLGARLAGAEMTAMSNDEMADVQAQAGVAISLDWRLNATANGTILPLCTDASTYKECRIAWAFNNRGVDDGTATTGKKWLVLKGFTGALYIPYLTVDASTVTYNTPTDSSATTKTIPAIKLSMGNPSSSYSGANTKVQVRNLVIDALAFEQDDNSRAVGYVRGYQNDSTCEPTGSGVAGAGCTGAGPAVPAGKNTGFMGLQINGPSNVANIQIDGTVKLFSCLADHPTC